MGDGIDHEDLIIRIFRQESMAGKDWLFTENILEHPLNTKPRQRGLLSSLARKLFPNYLTKPNIYTLLEAMVENRVLREQEEPDSPEKNAEMPRTVYSLGPGAGRRQRQDEDRVPKWGPTPALARI